MKDLFAKPDVGQDKFDLSNPEPLFEAMFRTLVLYQETGKQPGAEHWQADTRFKRPELISDIRAEWLIAVGQDALMPWHDDYLIYCWVSLRKLNKPQKVALCEWYGIEVPRKWTSGDDEVSANGINQ